MLKLKGLIKEYSSAGGSVTALKGIDLEFRRSEFVAILGPSGCGKTTLLNMIGGLDQYTEGDLEIGGVSTKDFSDSDWDRYRNHSVGFVFQNYNLIPHQTVLSNVELALTLSGVSKSERRRRAVDALEKVGLKDQIRKKPNQMSGGQMQRVAIARALVNDPEILLADEPTGALDSETSVQIMELLKEISKNRLVVMVTHNPDLADAYATRIIRLLDGRVTDDSRPYDPSKEPEGEERSDLQTKKRPSMSFFTALALSLNNLMTKKGRTILTAFAGSIGIIGIALILSLSNGITNYINTVQEDALSSYPIQIQAETVDLSQMISTLMGANQRRKALDHELDAVYSSDVMADLMNSFLFAQTQKNNLTLFREFLESNGGGIRDAASQIQYVYKLPMKIYTEDPDGELVASEVQDFMQIIYAKMGVDMSKITSAGGLMSQSSFLSSASSNSASRLWQEMLPGENGEGVSDLLKTQYDLICGSWPESYDQVVLVVNERNEISDLALGALGLKSAETIYREIMNGKDENAETLSVSYEDLLNKEFRLIPAAAFYQKNPDGTYTDLSETGRGLDYLYGSDQAITLKISAVVRQSENAVAGMLSSPIGTVGYTAALTRRLMRVTEEYPVVKEQIADPAVDVMNGLPFRTPDTEDYSETEKEAMIREYLAGLPVNERAEVYIDAMSTPALAQVLEFVESQLSLYTREQLEEQIIAALAAQETGGVDASYVTEYIRQMSDEDFAGIAKEMLSEMFRRTFRENAAARLASIPADQLSLLLAQALTPGTDASFTEEILLSLFDSYMPPTYSDSSYEDNLSLFGSVDEDHPAAINIFVSTFGDKDRVAEIIEEYNNGQTEEDRIRYTDLLAIFMSAMSTILNAISYILVAFAAISLVVSSIMIGIITYISVLERTKEIGILRAIGASKRDIARVFNAETMIEGFASGVMGILVTLLLILPINAIIRALTGISNLGASLPVGAGFALVGISVILTLIAGLIPSRIAAKKDPVVALSTE